MKTMKNIILRSLVLVVMAFIGLNAYAQTRVTGTVKDSKGEPVIGAAVILQGSTSVAAMTDLDGKYTITIPASFKNPSLRANIMGYVEQVIAVGGRSVVDFVMQEDAEELDEVVVVGYGSMRRSDLTGSVTSVKIDEGDASRSTSFDQMLQGRAAGVQVLNNGASPDAGVSIRIRGLASFNGSTEPLYVVDGVILNTSSTGGSVSLQNGSTNSSGDEDVNGLMGLNPQDIASMEILKDASATAIYGALGANGVVLITTKSAGRDKPTVRFNTGVDIRSAYKHQDVLSFDEYVDYLQTKVDMNISASSTALSTLQAIYDDPVNHTGLKAYPMDWQDEILRTSVSQRYYLSISGRPKSFSYAFSLGYNDNQGIIKNTSVQNYTMRLNLDKTVNKRFKFGTKTSLAYINSTMTQATGGGNLLQYSSLTRSMQVYRPFTTEDPNASDDEDDDDLRANPLLWIDPTHFINSRQEYRLNVSAYAEYKILPWLTFRSQAGTDYRNSERAKFRSSRINYTAEGSNGGTGTYESFYWNWDNTFQVNKKFKGGHTLTGSLGSTAVSNSSNTQSIQGWNIEEYKSGIASLIGAPNTSSGYSESANQTLSFFARAIYNYKDRYVLTATYRADGASKFAGKNKWAYFPSFAFAWRVNQEPWFNIPMVSMAKLRIGWGQTGNSRIGNYLTMSNYSSTSVPSHADESQYSRGLYPSNLANPSLKWETTEMYNLGLDLSLWKGRFALTVDAYDKVTYDLLQSKDIPSSSGFSTISINEGTIQNRGIEFTVDATPVKLRDFEWALNGNLSFNRNKIIKISEDAGTKAIFVTPDHTEDVVYFTGSSLASSNYLTCVGNIFMEGYPMGLFYGWKLKGVIGVGEVGTPITEGQTPKGEGWLDYYDLNGNGYIDEDDRTILGDPNPDFTYGFGTTFSYKRLSLTMNFVGSFGNDIINMNLATTTATSNVTQNIKKEAYYDAWSPTNPTGKYPALNCSSTDYTKKLSAMYIEDGSYLRLQSVSLSYDIPFKNGKILKNLGLSASVNNVYVWTKYSGWDPDVNSFGTNIKKMGCDSGSYPNNRAFSFDVKFTF